MIRHTNTWTLPLIDSTGLRTGSEIIQHTADWYGNLYTQPAERFNNLGNKYIRLRTAHVPRVPRE